MPELPEVETVKNGLLKVLQNNYVKKVIINNDNLRIKIPSSLSKRLKDAKVTEIIRKGKYILVSFENDKTLIIHLGMTGRLIIAKKDDKDAMDKDKSGRHIKHDHVIMDLKTGDKLIYNDVRRFGMIDITHTSKLSSYNRLASLGLDPLSDEFNFESFFTMLKCSSKPIKSFLLDQKYVNGLGNIYICEALHKTKISPYISCKNLAETKDAKSKIKMLNQEIKKILRKAIEQGGSTLNDYRKSDGSMGYFQFSFLAYGQEGKDCSHNDCQGKIIKSKQSGRSSFYCDTCQI